MATTKTSRQIPGSLRDRDVAEWLAHLSATFMCRLDSISDAALERPTRRRHITGRQILGHIHHHALVMTRLASSSESHGCADRAPSEVTLARWADWRDRSEHLPLRHLRDLVRWSQEDLEIAIAAYNPPVGLVWSRVRELAAHLLDLDDALTLDDLPPEIAVALAADDLACQPIPSAPVTRMSQQVSSSSSQTGSRR